MRVLFIAVLALMVVVGRKKKIGGVVRMQVSRLSFMIYESFIFWFFLFLMAVVTGLILSFPCKCSAHSGNFWNQTSYLIELNLHFYSGEKHCFQFL